MALSWETLPLLPLRCILDHLCLEDGLAAMSVCRHWRNAMTSVYEGSKDHVELRSTQPERNMFLARLFKKRVERLTVCIEGWTDEETEHLFYCALPEFYHAVKLREISFLGPSYLQHNQSVPAIKLKRVIVESLIVKNAQCITRLTFLGCEMDAANHDDRFMHDQIEYHSAPLTFPSKPATADSILSRPNFGIMYHSTLRQITLDYNMLSHTGVEFLPRIPTLAHVAVCVRADSTLSLGPLVWAGLIGSARPVTVAIYIVGLPEKRFDEVMANVLVEGLTLVSVKVLFCKTFYSPLLSHVVRYFKSTLRELVWVDAPSDVSNSSNRLVQSRSGIEQCTINPLILLCWQCVRLHRLVIHGYWIWQYDVLGCVRLRKSLRHLEVSAIYMRQNRFAAHADPGVAVRVFATDGPSVVTNEYVKQVNAYCALGWRPTLWPALHPGLRPRPHNEHIVHYLRDELRDDVGFAL